MRFTVRGAVRNPQTGLYLFRWHQPARRSQSQRRRSQRPRHPTTSRPGSSAPSRTQEKIFVSPITLVSAAHACNQPPAARSAEQAKLSTWLMHVPFCCLQEPGAKLDMAGRAIIRSSSLMPTSRTIPGGPRLRQLASVQSSLFLCSHILVASPSVEFTSHPTIRRFVFPPHSFM